MQRSTKPLTASENVMVTLGQGNALLVQIEADTFTGTIDFKSGVDPETFANTPYQEKHVASPSESIAQITYVVDGTTKEYLLLPPLRQVRIDVEFLAEGSLTLTWAEVVAGAWPA